MSDILQKIYDNPNDFIYICIIVVAFIAFLFVLEESINKKD